MITGSDMSDRASSLKIQDSLGNYLKNDYFAFFKKILVGRDME